MVGGGVPVVDQQPVTNLWVYPSRNVCGTFQTELHKLDKYVWLVLQKSLVLGSSTSNESILICLKGSDIDVTVKAQ